MNRDSRKTQAEVLEFPHNAPNLASVETLSEGPRAHHEERKDFFIERNGERFAGTHLIIDLVGASRLDDLKHIEETLIRCVEVSKATLLHIHLHHFTPNGGVSGVAVLSESHISIHTWPEANYAALDVFMCGEAEPQNSIAVLQEAFGPSNIRVEELRRGKDMV
ncbi:MAG: adenosylmethionine decarboxylase [Parvibaculum sp.]|uniref:adenosylmethionine decarboxylase n=1 Tax=Parvibaculum sp. TaxID=2024848 RepID=UPI003C78825C